MSVRFSIALFLSIAPLSVFAQGNIDWEELWKIEHPTTTNGPYGWMVGPAQYTGLAYDKWRDVVYVVNPKFCVSGQTAIACPTIRVLEAATGAISTRIGRHYQTGLPGELPVPPDTVIMGTLGWPNNSYGGTDNGKFGLYKIDLDDTGRIFACNLVSPIYGICFPGPPPFCDPVYLSQGPFRVYRWATPSDAPIQAYVTLTPQQTDIGTFGQSEMPWSRWGDAFEVVGAFRTYGSPPITVDSVKMYVSTGSFSGQSIMNREISAIFTDDRFLRPENKFGNPVQYRLGAILTSLQQGLSSHGLAATGSSWTDNLWMDSNVGQVYFRPIATGNTTFPTTIPMNFNPPQGLPDDTLTGTGKSGALAYFELGGQKYLICADGLPSNIGNPGQPNFSTRARVMNVTVQGQEHREPGLGNTPFMLGNTQHSAGGGTNNYIADVDYKIEYDSSSQKYHLILFVLMSHNGIAAYRSRLSFWPVELQTFRADVEKDDVRLSWITAKETGSLGFEIQRSFNGGTNWERISFVEGKGSTSIENRYEYIDPITDVHRNIGLVHYRLIQIDVDGGTEHSPIVSARIAASTKDFEFLPHTIQPASAPKISFAMKEAGHVTLKLYSMLGEELATVTDGWRSAGVHEQSIASPLPSGVYLCMAQTASGAYVTRFVLTR